MLIPYSWLKDFINLKAPAEAVGERLSLATVGVEEVRKEGKEQILNLEVTYNRGDLLSVIGVARELAALYNLKLQGEEERFKPLSDSDKLSVKSCKALAPLISELAKKQAPLTTLFSNENKDLSRLYTLTLIGDLSYSKTPEKIERRLEFTGMRSVNLFADITNYVMLEYGQPLHAFDAEKVRKRDKTLSIEVRDAKRGETIKTLDGSTHNLKTSDIVIADRKGPIAIAGVMGSQDTEVGPDTKELLLEAAIFNPIAIRKTARRLGLQSEASTRFEHYLSPENLFKALNKAVKLYQLYGKGRITGFGHTGEIKTTTEAVNLSRVKLNTLLGTKIDISEARKYLKQLGFKTMSSDKGLVAWPPHFRGDIACEEDLIEEVARLHSYKNLPATPPVTTATDTPLDEFEHLRGNLSKLLAGMGFSEVRSYPFLNTGASIHQNTKGLFKIKNPISSEAECLKDSDLLNLLEIAQKNAPRYATGKLFELEKIYPKEGEHFALTALLWGVSEPYRNLKGVLEALLAEAHLSCRFVPAQHNLLYPSRTAKIVVGNAEIGIIGEAHPHLTESYSLKNAALFELNLEEAAKYTQRWKTFTPIPKYPEVYEDFSFFLPYKKQLEPLIQKIKTLNGIIREAELTDLFDQKEKRSITLRLTFQSDTKELSSKDLKPTRDKISKLIRKSGGKLRG